MPPATITWHTLHDMHACACGNQPHRPKGSVIPTSDSTLHYGKGQTDVSLNLVPGEYQLTLQFADGVHSSFGKEMANSITIIVE